MSKSNKGKDWGVWVTLSWRLPMVIPRVEQIRKQSRDPGKGG